ncbi:CDGSH iron-sulfur domain-containing protein NEET [Lycium ferocissimum]|uniref:CDGSH iron-sulfur domain-containing protein NEET n=1 Tax=Lycium ferocissimum TaxID=112874 RepID=UPI00281662CC|nr:CDGSH iron-sulfur domain-containing protein NEET [Lycium ferocissimum]
MASITNSIIQGGFALSSLTVRPRRMVVVRAEAINPDIKKDEPKVVDSVVVTELSKPLTAYCRCWRSGTFPLCDGSHVKHNKATGDNVGPLLLKKQ